MARIVCAILDLGKDVASAVGYFKKGIEGLTLINATEVQVWELGITWFLGIYTTAGMYIPAFAYATMFSVLLLDFKDKWFYRFYQICSVPLSPIIGLLR